MDELKSPKGIISIKWIIGLIILILILWLTLFYIYMPHKNRTSTIADNSYSEYRFKEPVDTINEIRDFIQFVKNTGSTYPLKNEINYSEKGLIKLQSAISYLADRVDSTDSTLDGKINSLDQKVARIDTSSDEYITQLKPAFLDAVNVIETIQRLNYPDLKDQILKLSKAEKNINNRKPVKLQTANIESFFNLAGGILQQMKLSYSYTLNKAIY
jgi:hypothetical protein